MSVPTVAYGTFNAYSLLKRVVEIIDAIIKCGLKIYHNIKVKDPKTRN